ncbi:hypothetical protein ABIE26_003953 [Pedobacter africanus]|uniref:Uncharacterized protein n=1 Tax=Pedobacter africanus TaxID=151894 RepID=A0ACC6L176_9SPHI|nr:hypothetical protein [Pedobacter africanus]MDR6785254.1 hypothetical protein [Pedobacter africanus]
MQTNRHTNAEVIQQLSQDCRVFREIVASIEAGLYSELTGFLFCEMLSTMKQHAQIHTLLQPELGAEYLMEGKLLLFGILTRPYGVQLTPLQADKMVFVEMGLMDLYAFYSEMLLEIKS